jgi:predicted ATP-dependent serine protease
MARGKPVDGKRKQRYDLGQFFQYEREKVERRVVTDDEGRGEFPRLDIYGDLNDAFGGGLPYGLTTFYGEGGSGKSKIAGEIASAVAGNHDDKGPVIYVAAEAVTDIPEHENILGLKYTENKPKYNKAVDEIMGFCQEQQPVLLVIDSATKMFSKTDKAVEEADIRSALSQIEERAEGNLPVIATSEVRGNPGYTYPAGGQAVAHACAMLIRMRRREATTKRESEELGEPIGTITWTMSIEKDRENQADTAHLFKPVYTRRGLNLTKWEADTDMDE